mgnify:FL=1
MSLKQWHWEQLGKKAVEALKKNNFNAEYCENAAVAKQRLLELIPEQGSVGFGGSVTISDFNIREALAARGNQVLYHHAPGLTPEQVKAIRKQQLVCDCFVCSTNAITLDGKLVNVDGTGNRVAAMIFGPEKVIIVAGANKIVKDVDAALERIEMYTAPLNNKRLNTGNPCTITGICMDCANPNRICNVVTIMQKRPRLTDITVLVVG